MHVKNTPNQFNTKLYDAMCNAFPRTTVRSISRAMGMSDGYWSSVTSQGLKVSNAALIHLNELLEVRLIVLNGDSSKTRLIEYIQTMIAKEIVKRFAHTFEPIDKVWNEVSSASEHKKDETWGEFGAMPFVMLRG